MINSSLVANPEHIDRLGGTSAQQESLLSNKSNDKLLLETLDALAQLKCNQFMSQQNAVTVNHLHASTLSSSTSSTSSSSTTGYSSASALTGHTCATASQSGFMNASPAATSTIIFNQTNNLLMPMPAHLSSSCLNSDASLCSVTGLSSPSTTSITYNSCLLPITSPSALMAINNSVPCTTSIIGQKRNKRRSNNKSSKSQNSSFNKSMNNAECSDNSISYYSGIEPCNNSSASSNSSNNGGGSGSVSTSPSINKISLPYSCKVTIPKAPKPQRTLIVLESVIAGLNSNINEVKSKVSDLTMAVTNGYNALAKQLLQTEAYLRHLEQRISTLNKLQNSYQIHMNMKDGIQNMYDAFKKSPGNQYKNLTNIKNGWKECIQTLCAIEAQTEALLGTFQFQIEKLIGFARLCPGDTYELQIKYGSNAKFRTRTKIAKDGSQLWDSTRFSFKVTVHDLLSIKINEIKFLGKNLLVGERACDTKDLFATTHTQRLTFNANTSGTLKLSMLITWLPFENCEESFIYFNPTQYLTVNSKEKRLSSYNMSKLTSTVSDSCMNVSPGAEGRQAALASSNSSSMLLTDRSENKLAQSDDLQIEIDQEDSTSSKHSISTNPALNDLKNENDNDDNESSSSSSSAIISTSEGLTSSSHIDAKKLLKDCLQESADLPNQSSNYSTDSLSSSASSKSSSSSMSPGQAKAAKSSVEEDRFASFTPDNDVITKTSPQPSSASRSASSFSPAFKSPTTEKDVEKVLCDLLDNLVSSVSNRLEDELNTPLPKKVSPLTKSAAFSDTNKKQSRNSIVDKRISMIWLDQNIRNSLFLEVDDDVNRTAVASLIDLKNELDLGFIGLYSEDNMEEEELIESNSLKELIDLILDVRLKSPNVDLSKFHRDLQSPCLRKVFTYVETRLEDLRGQYIELNELYEQIQRLDRIFYRVCKLDRLLRRQDESEQSGADRESKEKSSFDDEPVLSVVVEDVLQCFDFLNAEVDNSSEDSSSPDSRSPTLTKTFSESVSLKLESLVDSNKALYDNSQCLASNPLWLLSFDLEAVLVQHLGACLVALKCLSQLNSVQSESNAFKLGQFEALLCEKLNREKTIIKGLLDLVSLDLTNQSLWSRTTKEERVFSEEKLRMRNKRRVDQITESVFANDELSQIKKTTWLNSINVNMGSKFSALNFLCAERSRVRDQIRKIFGVGESKPANQILDRLLERVSSHLETIRLEQTFPVEFISIFHFDLLTSLLYDESNTSAIKSLFAELSATADNSSKLGNRINEMFKSLNNRLTNAVSVDLILAAIHTSPESSIEIVNEMKNCLSVELLLELTVDQLMIKYSTQSNSQVSSSLSFLHLCLKNLKDQKSAEMESLIEFVQTCL